MDDSLTERLRRLAHHLPAFEAPGFSFGSWPPVLKNDDGSMTMPWYRFGPEAEAFLRDLGGWVTPFDWPAWSSSPEGEALLGHPEAVATATADDLRKPLTVYVRADRFSEGTLEAAFDSGMLTAIMRRAAVLAE